ncbi:Protein of unknown function [Cotesia congregata]|uniref:Uncharacterized protein n=1 Tax=Cotesia congregata TaxID=51543 RepID=A0A8J2HQL3_COTCN|nr:Protein of unknown function [Cotesia congregata]
MLIAWSKPGDAQHSSPTSRRPGSQQNSSNGQSFGPQSQPNYSSGQSFGPQVQPNSPEQSFGPTIQLNPSSGQSFGPKFPVPTPNPQSSGPSTFPGSFDINSFNRPQSPSTSRPQSPDVTKFNQFSSYEEPFGSQFRKCPRSDIMRKWVIRVLNVI